MSFFKKPFVLLLIWAPLFGLTLGCQKKDPSETNTYLIPWLNAAGEYKLQAVTLNSLNSPYVMDGAAAQVYIDQGFQNDGLAGTPAHVRLTEVDGVYVPQDASSSIAVTIYAHFENLKRMEETYQLPTRMDWPRKVGTDVPVRLPNGDGEVNNARYFASEDVIGITPFTAKGLHMAINAGILAHEHFHGIFERTVMPVVYSKTQTNLLASFEAFKDLVGSWPAAVGEIPTERQGEEQKLTNEQNLPSKRMQNLLVLRSWNEGLADFFAYVYTSNPDFMNLSVPQNTREARRLDEKPLALRSVSNLEHDMSQFSATGKCPQGFCMAYTEGTKLARMLYEVWNQLPTRERPAFMREVIGGLPKAAKNLVPDLDKEVMSLNSIIPYLISAKRVGQAKTCKTMAMVMAESASLLETYAAPCGEVIP